MEGEKRFIEKGHNRTAAEVVQRAALIFPLRFVLGNFRTKFASPVCKPKTYVLKNSAKKPRTGKCSRVPSFAFVHAYFVKEKKSGRTNGWTGRKTSAIAKVQ